MYCNLLFLHRYPYTVARMISQYEEASSSQQDFAVNERCVGIYHSSFQDFVPKMWFFLGTIWLPPNFLFETFKI